MVLCCECVAPYLTLLMQSVSVSVMRDEEGCFILIFMCQNSQWCVLTELLVVLVRESEVRDDLCAILVMSLSRV